MEFPYCIYKVFGSGFWKDTIILCNFPMGKLYQARKHSPHVCLGVNGEQSAIPLSILFCWVLRTFIRILAEVQEWRRFLNAWVIYSEANLRAFPQSMCTHEELKLQTRFYDSMVNISEHKCTLIVHLYRLIF